MTIANRLALRSSLTALILAASLAPAHAQSAAADILFREGKKLMKAGRTAEACDKFDASERIESSVGTLLNLADCREKNGQLSMAWATFNTAAADAKRAGNDAARAAEAHRRADLLEPRLDYLTINAPSAKIDGLVITRDGVAVDPALWNQPLPIDPGTYQVAASAPGRGGFQQKVAIAGEAKKITVDVPALVRQVADTSKQPATGGAISAPPASVHAPAPTDRATVEQPVQPDAQPSAFTGRRELAIGVGVAGVAVVAVGIGLGVHSNSLENQANMICPTDVCNDPMGRSLNSSAQSYASDATVAYVAGGVLVAGAVVLWLTGAPHVEASGGVTVVPMLSRDGVGIGFGGRL